MSDLGFNKIAFCILGTGLMLIGLNEASHAFFRTEHHEKDAYHIEIPEPTTGVETAVVEGPRDYGTLLAAADVEAGKAVSLKCTQCHKFEPGAEPLQGPTLFGVLGRDIASVPGFKYSTGKGSMSEQEGAWDYAKLDRYIERPKAMVPATAMNFAGINNKATGQRDRANLIAYMRTLTTGEPMPLPAPLPPQPTAAEGAAPAEGAVPAAAEGTPAPAQPAPATPAPTQH